MIRPKTTIEWDAVNADLITDIWTPLYEKNLIGQDIDKYSTLATEIAHLQEIYSRWIYVLEELRAMRAAKLIVPGLNEDDASSGEPITMRSFHTLMDTWEKAQLWVPSPALAIADLRSFIIQLGGSIKYGQKWAAYFYPSRPQTTLANLEAEITTIRGLMDGYVVANDFHFAGFPFSRGMADPLGPIPLNSDLGITYAAYIPISDDVPAPRIEQFDANTDLYFSQWYGIPNWYDALAVFRVGATTDETNGWANPNGAANDYNWEETAMDGTWADIADDNAYLPTWHQGAALHQSLTWGLIGAYALQKVPAASLITSSEGDWTERLVDYLSAYIRGYAPPAVRTLAPLIVDLPQRGALSDRASGHQNVGGGGGGGNGSVGNTSVPTHRLAPDVPPYNPRTGEHLATKLNISQKNQDRQPSAFHHWDPYRGWVLTSHFGGGA
jgi:hypothetical protein